MSFNLNAPAAALLWQALNLEKGSHQFYERLVSQYESGPVAETIGTLLKAEAAHSKAVHELISQVSPSSAGNFDEAYGKLSGELLENGTSFDVALRHARELGASGELALLELALEIEFGAYDLYKNLALASEDPTARRDLLALAEQEKAHADLVLKALGSAAVKGAELARRAS
jgi:rubrerythrin